MVWWVWCLVLFGVSGWSGGSGLFFVLFFEMEKGPMWLFFLIFLSCFVDFWSLEDFFDDFGVLGSSLDAFGAGGVQGGDLVELIRSVGPLWLRCF